MHISTLCNCIPVVVQVHLVTRLALLLRSQWESWSGSKRSRPKWPGLKRIRQQMYVLRASLNKFDCRVRVLSYVNRHDSPIETVMTNIWYMHSG